MLQVADTSDHMCVNRQRGVRLCAATELVESTERSHLCSWLSGLQLMIGDKRSACSVPACFLVYRVGLSAVIKEAQRGTHGRHKEENQGTAYATF